MGQNGIWIPFTPIKVLWRFLRTNRINTNDTMERFLGLTKRAVNAGLLKNTLGDILILLSNQFELCHDE